ncbi:MAG: hypothetical protein O3C27_09475 [Actinomycetota bacterium]|nr:hypothetical protein [Actinomycetota bacterium]
MPRISPDLDTPFRTGEKVRTTRDLPGVPEGSRGRVKLVNGLHTWVRYWVTFNNGEIMGQLSQDDLVRPDMVAAWHERAARASVASPSAGAGEPAAVDAAPAAEGAAGLIPAAILERSRAAKARLLG